MSDFCGIQEGQRFDMVGKMEDVGAWGPPLLARLGLAELAEAGWGKNFFPSGDYNSHNKRAAAKLRRYYTPELAALVADIYREDFVRFGYSTRLHDIDSEDEDANKDD